MTLLSKVDMRASWVHYKCWESVIACYKLTELNGNRQEGLFHRLCDHSKMDAGDLEVLENFLIDGCKENINILKCRTQHEAADFARP